MTKTEMAYAETLNIFGSTLYQGSDEEDIQDIIDNEHVLACPAFADVLKRRRASGLSR